MNSVFVAWMVEVGIITARDLTQEKKLPLPSELLASMVVFGAIGAVAESETFSAVGKTTAWGLVIATLLSTASSKSSNFGVLQSIGDFLSGATPTPATKGGN